MRKPMVFTYLRRPSLNKSGRGILNERPFCSELKLQQQGGPQFVCKSIVWASIINREVQALCLTQMHREKHRFDCCHHPTGPRAPSYQPVVVRGGCQPKCCALKMQNAGITRRGKNITPRPQWRQMREGTRRSWAAAVRRWHRWTANSQRLRRPGPLLPCR